MARTTAKKKLTITRRPLPSIPIPVPLSVPFRHPSPPILIVPTKTTTKTATPIVTTRNHRNHRSHRNHQNCRNHQNLRNRRQHGLANRILSVPASVLRHNGPFKNQAWRCRRFQGRRVRPVVGVVAPNLIWGMTRVLVVVSTGLKNWQPLGEDRKVSNFYECDDSFNIFLNVLSYL